MLTKQEKLTVLAGEQERLEHGLYAAEVDVVVSESTPDDAGRLEAAKASLTGVQTRLQTLAGIRAQVEAEPEPEPAATPAEVAPGEPV